LLFDISVSIPPLKLKKNTVVMENYVAMETIMLRLILYLINFPQKPINKFYKYLKNFSLL